MKNNDSYKDKLMLVSFYLDTGNMIEGAIDKAQFSGIGLATIYVYGGEGKIPHFHIVGKSFETCVRLYEAKYFRHEGKMGLLNTKQRKILDKVMRTQHGGLAETNWQFACALWDSANETNTYSRNRKQPDYTSIDEG